MICQFSADGDKPTLGDLYKFPGDVYPVGRLDTDSEGLLILTNDKSLNNRLLNPNHKHNRTYFSQVEGNISTRELDILSTGIIITVDGKSYKTLPAKAEKLMNDPELPDRIPSIRVRKAIPTSWIKLTLCEGKNRQVRKMTASVGFPTLRLIRISIEGLNIEGMIPGEVREINKELLFQQLFSI